MYRSLRLDLQFRFLRQESRVRGVVRRKNTESCDFTNDSRRLRTSRSLKTGWLLKGIISQTQRPFLYERGDGADSEKLPVVDKGKGKLLVDKVS